MSQKIPNSVIGAVSSVIAAHYYSHSKLNTLFMESGAPGEPPPGNCEEKCRNWLKRCNDEPDTNPLEVLGGVIQDYMDREPPPYGHHDALKDGKSRIIKSLEKNQLTYQTNGYIVLAGANPTTKTLTDYLNAGDFASIEKEFDRAISHINTDPHASITAASAIIEALCKTYIETFELEMPSKQTIVPLWKTVQGHLGLNLDRVLGEDQRKMLQGLASVIDGIGAFRTHIGSAHGRGIAPPNILVADARLAVNAAHTLVVFVMERWHQKSA